MSKLDEKFLEQYSIDTLRDVEFSTPPSGDDQLFYENDSWVNKPASVFGRDFAEFEKIGQQNFSGNQFEIYTSLSFTASGGGTNKYRFNCNFLWGHDSASNDIRVGIRIDGGSLVKEIRIEPKDTGNDQRIDSEILKYFRNISDGAHTIDLLVRPSNSTRTSRVYEAQMEVWRCQ